MQKFKIGVIGAGASGYFAAIHAASKNTEVVLLEKTTKSLSKVKISGGGRCNVTHASYEISNLSKNYPRGEKFLKKVFRHFAVSDTVAWFSDRGVEVKTEADGRMFPVTNDSQTIVDALEAVAARNQVKIKYKVSVEKIEVTETGFRVVSKAEKFDFDRLIVCSGGSLKLEGFTFLKALGHSIVPPVPSLFTFNTPQEPIRNLMGISVSNAQVKLESTKLLYKGPLLITHWGVSGPAVLKLSAFGAQWMAEKHYKAKAHIKWDESWTEEFLVQELQGFKRDHPKKVVSSNPLFKLPARLWEHLCDASEIDKKITYQNLPKKCFNKLVQNLFCYIVTIDGKTTFKEEFVTAGGVALDEVNPENMESKLIKGLFFAGEVLNIDGITGGFNFQAAWSTAFLAGINANYNTPNVSKSSS